VARCTGGITGASQDGIEGRPTRYRGIQTELTAMTDIPGMSIADRGV